MTSYVIESRVSRVMRPKVILLLAALLLGVSFCRKNTVDKEDEEDPPQGKIVYGARWGDQYAKYQIYSMNIDGSDLRQLTFSQKYHSRSPRWSPDGAQILFTSDSLTPRDVGGENLYLMDTTGSNLQPVKRDEEYMITGNRPVWSPDGQKIADYGCRWGCYGNAWTSTIYVIELAHGWVQWVSLFTTKAFDPTWSPDGSRIVFVAREGDGSLDLYVVDPATATWGNPPERLTFMDTYKVTPAWSPDGNKIAFLSDWKILVYHWPGGEIDSAAIGPSPEGLVPIEIHCWSPDGKDRLLVSYAAKGRYRYSGYLYLVDIAGETVKAVLDDSTLYGAVYGADWVRN